ncbi:MAG: sensor histidine kinase [Mariniphaga sp.]
MHLKARNAIGVWSDEVVSDEIVILPPFYQTWWFMLLLILFLSFIIYWIFSYAAQKQYAIRLSRQVIIRTKQLKESQRELQKINKSREKIYSIIAHDLRSPFNSILGLTEILHKESVVVSAERKKLMIKSLYQTAHQTYFLLENLLNWVRSQRGDLNFKPQSTDLREHVKEIQNLLAGVASNKNIMLINRIKEECFVYADVNMLRTIIRNLLSNAIKFTGEGGMVEIFSSRNTDKVEVCIKDNGTGMTNEKLQSIFTSGISPGSGTGSEAGTGLGLLLCKEFVEQHGGTIKAKSTLHKGSEFCFSLPLPEDK